MEGLKTIISLTAFVLNGVIVSCACHVVIKQPAASITMSALFSAITFQIIGYLVIGYFDPFAIIAFFFSGILYLAISAFTYFFVYMFYLEKLNARKQDETLQKNED